MCAKPHLHLQRAGILALWGGSRYYWFRSWAQLVHWQQQDYTQPAKDIWEVVEGHCSMCLISDLRANTAGMRDWQVHTTWRYCGVCTRQTNFSGARASMYMINKYPKNVAGGDEKASGESC
jgi:hypothetical protein